MSEKKYEIHTDIRFGPLESIDVQGLADACQERWFNQTLCQVNESVIRLGVVQGEFHWHHHETEDELFYVVEGRLLVDVRDPAGDEQTFELGPGQGVMVPHQVVHRTRAPVRTVMLMVEPATVAPTGDDARPAQGDRRSDC